MAGKYTPLEQYLQGLPVNKKEASFSFAQIESILKSALPASAYEDERWWRHATEGNHRSRRAWVQAGWQIASLKVGAQQVKFRRV